MLSRLPKSEQRAASDRRVRTGPGSDALDAGLVVCRWLVGGLAYHDTPHEHRVRFAVAVVRCRPSYQVIEEAATRGLVMTDSTFTRNALQQIAAYRFQMEGADGDRIRQWLEALRTGTPGSEV